MAGPMTLAHYHSEGWYRPIATPRSSWWPSALIFCVVFVSFRPLSSQVAEELSQPGSGGDIVNQLGFGLLGLLCMFLMVKKSCTNSVAAIANPVWLLLLPVLALAVVTADNPASSFRAMLFSLIVVLAAVTAMSLPRNMSEIVSALGASSVFVIGFCYLAVFFFPEQGVHTGGSHEAQHAGLWRGVFDHKNVASNVMGALAIIGWFVARNGRPALGMLVMAAALLFVVQAGSKTVLGILPVAILAAALSHWISWRFLKVTVILAPIVALSVVTLGAVIHPPILAELQSYVPGLTYTGRTDLWSFGLDHLMRSPLLGYGYESFWNTPRVINLEQPIELSWDVRGIVHGHNSWLDSSLAFGLPGALVVMAVLVVMPLRDYFCIPGSGNAGKLATLFICLWTFTMLSASLESFFFRRADPMWFCMLIAVTGLRLTAHMSRQGNYSAAPR
jgi:O-antigen ligase